MAMEPIIGLPGIQSERSAQPRRVLKNSVGAAYLPGGVVIDGSHSRDPANTGDVDVLRAGMVLGKVSATGFFAPSIIGVLPSAHTSSGTTVTALTIGVANAVELVRRVGSSGTFKLTGPPSAAGTVAVTTVTYSAVDVVTGIVTITDIAVNKIAGSFIQAIDGSESPLCILDRGYGVKVTDSDAASADQGVAEALIAGVLDSSQIINFPSDTSLRTWLCDTQLNSQCHYTYDHKF